MGLAFAEWKVGVLTLYRVLLSGRKGTGGSLRSLTPVSRVDPQGPTAEERHTRCSGGGRVAGHGSGCGRPSGRRIDRFGSHPRDAADPFAVDRAGGAAQLAAGGAGAACCGSAGQCAFWSGGTPERLDWRRASGRAGGSTRCERGRCGEGSFSRATDPAWRCSGEQWAGSSERRSGSGQRWRGRRRCRTER